MSNENAYLNCIEAKENIRFKPKFELIQQYRLHSEGKATLELTHLKYLVLLFQSVWYKIIINIMH